MPNAPQVTLELAQAGRPFVIRLDHPDRAQRTLMWFPTSPEIVVTVAWTRRTELPFTEGMGRIEHQLADGWTYAPWTISDSRGLFGAQDDLALSTESPTPGCGS